MSTFNGIVKEFPHIRIDYFRRSPEEKNPPLAYLLSHVHSDHLTGLVSCKSPFIYCSPATRDVLLGLEKYQHRMNFAKQILEASTKTYRHLKKILRPIPLETPTTLELAPGNEIRVTLFDANHCVGAVMFLIESDGHAVLYTGDIRSEPWWVNGLTKHPLLVPYVARDATGQARKPLKTLDCIYADTTFASKEDPYKRFPSKSEGLIELLDKVSKYPKGTSFHFKAWTFGYEEVWEALASHLGTRVHVDAYKWKLYRALANGVETKSHDAAKYTGFKNGNSYQEGCLTQDTGTKLHSCEKGTECAIWNKDFVQITPIITRHNGIEMAEIGAGGGQGDLGQHELDINDMQTLGMLFSLVMSKVQDGAQQKAVIEMLNDFMTKGKSSIAFDDFDFEDEEGPDDVDGKNEDIDRPIGAIVPILARLAAQSRSMSGSGTGAHTPLPSARSAPPKQITFPYSRHSSYSELCDLIGAFKPLDIYPCTVDSVNWNMESSISFLFGHIYTGGTAKVFSHDQYMISKMSPKKNLVLPASRPSTSGSQTSRSSSGEQIRERGRRRDSSDDSDEGTSCKRRIRGSRDDREERVREGQR
ncbi:hypothetical protein EJ03DRAFT_276957 [Teratosphaeria nubilosa]|uniref:Metallo-beta-lactamase domain-containing protein n=1 Tax=Teratosphaeria nubilosa TaxID=161662 RepID=A0A6G1L254_9PEZI|nr:hypothetical protein EJ03DRAFT_276957 [Teratosphaeria nubilosa]